MEEYKVGDFVPEMTLGDIHQLACEHPKATKYAVLGGIVLLSHLTGMPNDVARADYDGTYHCHSCIGYDCETHCEGPDGPWDGMIHVYDNPVEMYAAQFGEWLVNHPEGYLAIIATSFGVGQLIKGLVNRQK